MTDLDVLKAAQQQRRIALQAAIAALPDEAFSYLAMELWPRSPSTQDHAIWPDGLGGFIPASQTAIVAVLDAATRYCTQGASGYKGS